MSYIETPKLPCYPNKTPWKLVPTRDNRAIICDVSGQPIAVASYSNADLIVRSVNAHEQLADSILAD